MEVGLVNSFSSLSGGRAAVQSAKINGEKAKFSDLVQNLSGKMEAERSRHLRW